MFKQYKAQILQIIDHNENDVTDNILCYVGPRYDWHNTKFTPNFFNCEFLTFQMVDGNEIVIRKESDRRGEHKKEPRI